MMSNDNRMKQCLDNIYTKRFYRYVNDNGEEEGEWKYGTYASVSRFFMSKYKGVVFFVDQNGLLY